MSSNTFELIETLRAAIDQLNKIMIGGVEDTVTISGVTKPSISKEINDAFEAIQAAVQGRLSYATKAAMDADLAHPANTLAEVWNDPTTTNNGLYGKVGASGSGSWAKSPYDYLQQAVAYTNDFANRPYLFFTGNKGRIKVDPTTGAVTYPAGIVEKDGTVYLAFNETTLPGSKGVSNRAVFHYFDRAALVAGQDPFKTLDGGDAIPTWTKDMVFLGTSYVGDAANYVSYFPFYHVGTSPDELLALSNRPQLFFNDKIKVTRGSDGATITSVTYPGGYAIRNATGFNSWAETTVAITPSVTNFTYFDFSELLKVPVGNPIKTRTNSDSPVIPAPSGDYVTLGIVYGSTFTSVYESELTGEPRTFGRLRNEAFNGNLNDAGAGVAWYGDTRPTTTDAAPVAPIVNATLNDLGCFHAMQVAQGSPFRGNFFEVPFKQKGFTDPKYCFASVLVHSSDGTWDFAGQSGPCIYVVHENFTTGAQTNAQAGTLADPVDLGNNVRRYAIKFALTAPAAGSFISMFRLGFRAGAAATATFSVTGFWVSASSDSFRLYNRINIEDTSWPNWGAVSGLEQTRVRTDIAGLQSRVTSLEAPAAGTLESLARALLDPLHSVQIRLIGDSITWGSGASNLSPSSPRAHQLTDVRNNLQSPTWANLLRDYLGKAYCDTATLIEENPLVTGSGYYQKVATLDPTNKDPRFRFVHPTTGKYIPTSLLTYQTRSGPYFGRCIDFINNVPTGLATNYGNYGAYVEFDLWGDNLKVIYAGQSAGTNRYCDVYVDGSLVGSWGYGAAVLWQQESPEFTFPFGKHKVQLRNRSTDGGAFRLEGIRVTKKVRVINDGIIGTWTGEWLPGSSLLSGVSSSDEFVFVQLGTNDRAQSSVPNDPIRTMDNLRAITTYLRDTLGKKPLLLACCAVTSEPPDTYKYNQGDVARVIYDLSQELNVDMVDQYRATIQLKIDGTTYLSDGLHPNDFGYRVMFENLRDSIEAARPK